MDLIIDIGNGSVGAALTLRDNEKKQSGKPRVLYSLRELVLFEEKPSGDALQSAVLRALETSIVDVLKKGVRYAPKGRIHIDSIFCVLSSPWFISKGKTVAIAHDKMFVMSDRFLNDIVDKETQDFDIGLSEGKKSRLIERVVVSGTVNGYSLSHLVGQKTREADISLYMSKADDAFLKGVETVIHTHVSAHQDIIFHTFPFIAFSSIREIFPDVHNYIHIDIAGEITDIAVVTDNMIQKTVSYPSGKNLLTRVIAKQFGVTGDAARSLFHMYAENRLDTEVAAGVAQALSMSEEEWGVYMENALGDRAALPKRIFLTAYPQTAQIFETFLKTSPDITVTYMHEDLLRQFVEFNPGHDIDSFLALETFFVSRFL